MTIGQVPDSFRALVQTVQPKIAIVRNSDGVELWLDPFSGRVGIPGHHIEVRFGVPPDTAYTNPAAFFASELGSVFTSPGPFGIPLWIILAATGVGMIYLLSRRHAR